jgi:tetratricopeptide (TPR) repeat protein
MSTSNLKLPDFDALWDYDDPGASEQQFRALLPIAQQSNDRSYHAQLLTQIARAEGLQRRFADAHTTLDAALGLLTPHMGQARIRYLLERGRVFNSSGQIEQARPFFLEAWEAAQALQEDFYAVDAAHMLAIVEPLDQQLDWHLRALALAGQSRQPRVRKWLGSLYNNIGWTYHAAGEYQQALDSFEKALAAREATDSSAHQIRIAHWCVARALRSLQQFETALAIQQRLCEELDRSGATDGYVYEELAECLLALNRPGESKQYFTQAYATLSKDPWLAENEPARIQRLHSLGHIAE